MTAPVEPRSCRACGRKLGLSGRGQAICKSCMANYHYRTTDGVYGGRGVRKMTPEDVVEARRMRSQFKTTKEIARHFGVSIRTLRKYLDGTTS